MNINANVLLVGFLIGLTCGGLIGMDMTRTIYRTESCEKGYAVRTIDVKGESQWMWICDAPTNSNVMIK